MSDDTVKLSLTVEGYDAEQANDWLLERLSAYFAKALEKRITEEVKSAVQRIVSGYVERAAEERATAAVDEVLAAGWQKTDEYGSPRGLPMSLKDRVTEHLFTAQRWDRTTAVDKILNELLDKALREDVGQALAKAKEQITAEVDKVIAAKLGETMRTALGLK